MDLCRDDKRVMIGAYIQVTSSYRGYLYKYYYYTIPGFRQHPLEDSVILESKNHAYIYTSAFGKL